MIEYRYEINSSWLTAAEVNRKTALLSACRHSKKYEIGGTPVTVTDLETGNVIATYQNGKRVSSPSSLLKEDEK